MFSRFWQQDVTSTRSPTSLQGCRSYPRIPIVVAWLIPICQLLQQLDPLTLLHLQFHTIQFSIPSFHQTCTINPLAWPIHLPFTSAFPSLSKSIVKILSIHLPFPTSFPSCPKVGHNMLYAIVIILQPIIHPIWIFQYLHIFTMHFSICHHGFFSPSCSCPWHTFGRSPAPRSAPAAARSSPAAAAPPCPAPADRRRAATRSPTGPDREPEAPHPKKWGFNQSKQVKS